MVVSELRGSGTRTFLDLHDGRGCMYYYINIVLVSDFLHMPHSANRLQENVCSTVLL